MPLDGCGVLGYFETMTNFFDIASPQEVAAQFSSGMNATETDFARKLLTKDKDHNLACLVFLFLSRGDKSKAQNYFDQIESIDRQSEVALLIGELVEL